MKPKKKRKVAILVFISIMMLSKFGYSQSRYLKITLSDKKYDYVSFPPGTEFELKDKNDKLVYSNKDTINVFSINEKHKLIVYPDWKTSTDVFYISNGKIEQVDTKYFNKTKALKKVKKSSETYVYDRSQFTNGLTMKKTLEPSKLYPDRYNATFKFNNGIIATYKDGEFKAKLNDKDLIVGYKYFIYSEFGIIKLSFRPKTGKTWWVFEPNKD